MLKTFARVKFGLEFVRKDKYIKYIHQKNHSLVKCDLGRNNAIFYVPDTKTTCALKLFTDSIQFSNFEIFSEYYGLKIF